MTDIASVGTRRNKNPNVTSYTETRSDLEHNFTENS